MIQNHIKNLGGGRGCGYIILAKQLTQIYIKYGHLGAGEGGVYITVVNQLIFAFR